MDNFKRKITIRLVFLTLLLVSVLAVYLILFMNQDELKQASNWLVSFQRGILFGISILLILDTFKYLRVRGDEEKLRKLYIKENDERSIKIMEKAATAGINICILGLALATIISGYFNELVFSTLLGATLFVGLIKGLCKIYYSRAL